MPQRTRPRLFLAKLQFDRRFPDLVPDNPVHTSVLSLAHLRCHSLMRKLNTCVLGLDIVHQLF